MKEVLGLINQFGLPLVLFIALAWAYDKKQKEQTEERKAWEEEKKRIDKAHADERKAWEEEKNRLYSLTIAAQAERLEDSEKFTERMIRSQEAMTNVVNKTSEIAAQYERDRREIREAREQELRATGGHAPWKGGVR